MNQIPETALRLRELQEIRYEEETANLKLSGLNAFKLAKSVIISIDNPEEFLNAIKTALADAEDKTIKFGKAK
ncbi:hypothetical protein N8E89_28595 (plasmid) [Phyllobacterium sp. A18/5-2]|uniref:hypothetical protein n=1 Tax=Phyllobacterium sp. A18/5-2 TaxID=2978392 RepID=UPI0021C96721|nr:hypothetical protein [Phyllobacterium sp. A18/5-2]UXN67470.1 hypothetical protein N8E89_28595 [Phyllobacterium sp. A18/5-2]